MWVLNANFTNFQTIFCRFRPVRLRGWLFWLNLNTSARFLYRWEIKLNLHNCELVIGAFAIISNDDSHLQELSTQLKSREVRLPDFFWTRQNGFQVLDGTALWPLFGVLLNSNYDALCNSVDTCLDINYLASRPLIHSALSCWHRLNS